MEGGGGGNEGITCIARTTHHIVLNQCRKDTQDVKETVLEVRIWTSVFYYSGNSASRCKGHFVKTTRKMMKRSAFKYNPMFLTQTKQVLVSGGFFLSQFYLWCICTSGPTLYNLIHQTTFTNQSLINVLSWLKSFQDCIVMNQLILIENNLSLI